MTTCTLDFSQPQAAFDACWAVVTDPRSSTLLLYAVAAIALVLLVIVLFTAAVREFR